MTDRQKFRTITWCNVASIFFFFAFEPLSDGTFFQFYIKINLNI